MMKKIFFIFTALTLAQPVTASAQTMVQCMMARNQGMISPACNKILGLSTEPAKVPEDNGGLHLKQVIDYKAPSNSVGQASILGLTLGMSLEDARKIMTAHCEGEPHQSNTFLTVVHKGVQVKTQFFPMQLGCLIKGDGLRVTFSPPVSGNVITKIERTVSYPADASPSFTGLKADLAEKYNIHLMKNDTQDIIYSLEDGSISERPEGSLLVPTRKNPDYAPTAQAYIFVNIRGVSGNPENVSYMEIFLEDTGAENRLNDEVIKQMNAFVDDKLSTNTVKATL
ncbi:hypothetical protein [Acetobacter senegalensis]|uniref:hypothetical protein n=1 Tax=Acetobacter senegalensis TaxID=446692 RepID=UPI0012FDF555|nr:hypothetical protein [Acetobacter senegalensis]